jgi:predicted amidohydrolase YtcJ
MRDQAIRPLDLLIEDCRFPLTEDSTPMAVGVVRGRIAVVSPSGSRKDLRRSAATVVDAGGRSLLPGFIDTHVHVPEAGVESARCDLSEARSAAEILEKVRQFAESDRGEWIVGRGWSLDRMGGKLPAPAELDAVSAGKPAYLAHEDGHSAWVNSEALRRIGRTGDAGRVEILFEEEMQLVTELLPPLTKEELRDGLLAGQAKLHSFGVTAWQDAIVGPFVPTTDTYSIYSDASQACLLTGRVRGDLWWPRDVGSSQAEMESKVAELCEQRDALPEGRFSCDTVKIMYDGVCETQTAAVTRPYKAGARRFGLTFFGWEAMAEAVLLLDRAGFHLHFHAIGDRAVRDCLDAIEAAVGDNPPRRRRHQIAHIQLIQTSDAERMARLGVIANMQPAWAQFDAAMTALVLPTLDPTLAASQYPLMTLSDSGVRLAFGSDWSSGSPNPMDWVHVAVNRHHPQHSLVQEVFQPEQRLTRMQALSAATANGALALGLSGCGVIERGARADLALLDRDLDACADSELYDVKVDLTLVDGSPVFDRREELGR